MSAVRTGGGPRDQPKRGTGASPGDSSPRAPGLPSRPKGSKRRSVLFPHRTVRDNVAFPLQVQGQPKSKRWEVSQRCLSLVNLDG